MSEEKSLLGEDTKVGAELGKKRQTRVKKAMRWVGGSLRRRSGSRVEMKGKRETFAKDEVMGKGTTGKGRKGVDTGRRENLSDRTP